jgi:hypothetical protein
MPVRQSKSDEKLEMILVVVAFIVATAIILTLI